MAKEKNQEIVNIVKKREKVKKECLKSVCMKREEEVKRE